MDAKEFDRLALAFFEHCLSGLDPDIESNQEIIEELTKARDSLIEEGVNETWH